MGIVPCKQGRKDKIQKHETKNLIICPVPYDQSFMETFYEGWNIVKQFILAHGEMPKEINLSSGLDRLVCKELVSRKKFPILEVIEVLKTMGQPHLMMVENKQTQIYSDDENLKINRIITPVSLLN